MKINFVYIYLFFLVISIGCCKTYYTIDEQKKDIKVITEGNKIYCPDSLTAINIAVKYIKNECECVELIPLLKAEKTKDGLWWIVTAYQVKGNVQKDFSLEIRVKDRLLGADAGCLTKILK